MADQSVRALLPRLPKALLHDHLDGGLRPETLVELADQQGYDGLPERDPQRLAEWIAAAAGCGSLEAYLEPFAHTVAVLQDAASLRRVAREAIEDLAADHVVYAELRFAPELHTERGLTPQDAVTAVLEGFREGEGVTREQGTPIVARALLSAMRTSARSEQIARLVTKNRDAGVVGFDIAGAEAGFPPSRHLAAFEYLRFKNAHITIHAGEAFGLPSIAEAVAFCGCERLGHGVRIVDDIEVRPDGHIEIGRLASYVRDLRIPLELCPSSNLQTGAADSIDTHPIGLLADLRFRVTVNTDNRLVSATTMTREMTLLHDAFGWGLDRFEWVTINALKSAFIPFDERLALINEVVKPAYAAAADGSVT